MESVTSGMTSQGSDFDEMHGIEPTDEWDWKAHVRDYQKKGTNYIFQGAYCPKQITGGRTRLMQHFLPHASKGARDVQPCRAVPADVFHACSRTFAAEQKKAAAISKLKRVSNMVMADDPLQKRLKPSTSFPTARQATIDECTELALLQETRDLIAQMFYAESILVA